MNGDLYVGGTINNTGLTSALALKASLAAPSFTGTVVSAGDVSLNANLTVAGTIVNAELTNALSLKANIASPALTGTPTAPTASVGTNTTQIATTAYVRGEISALVASAPGTLDTLNELATALGNDAAFSTTVTNSIALKAPLASPTFTGAFVVSSADASFNGNLYVDGSIVNTGLTSALGLKAPLASPSFTGTIVSAGDVSLNAGLRVASDSSFNGNLFINGSIVNTGLTSALGLKAPLASPSFTGSVVSAGDVSLNAGLAVASDASMNGNLCVVGSIVNTGLTSALGLKAPLASPELTGLPTAPTATVGTNTTQIATTAYVRSEISALVASAPSTLDTLNELAAALGNDAAFSTTITNSLATKAPSASPTFTGTFLVSSSDSSFNGNLFVNGSIVNAGLSSALGLKSNIASPTFTGTITTPGLIVNNGTASNSTTAGAIVVTGGVGISGNINVGGVIQTTLTTQSTSSTTGALIVSGGIGVAGNVNIGGNVTINDNFFINQTNTTTPASTQLGYTVENTSRSTEATNTQLSSDVIKRILSFQPPKGVWMVNIAFSFIYYTTNGTGAAESMEIVLSTTDASLTPHRTFVYFTEQNDNVGGNGGRRYDSCLSGVINTNGTTVYYINANSAFTTVNNAYCLVKMLTYTRIG
jgi:hypothetical protein